MQTLPALGLQPRAGGIRTKPGGLYLRGGKGCYGSKGITHRHAEGAIGLVIVIPAVVKSEKFVRDLSHSFLVLLLIALYTTVMIKTFRDKDTERLFNREAVKRFREIERAARRKLEMVDAAEVLDNLRFPPGNRLEALKGNRKGHHSVRINDQCRACFVWGDDNNAYDVEVCDYH